MKKLFFIFLPLIIAVATLFYYYENNSKDYDSVGLLKKIREKTNTNNTYFYFNIWNTSCVPCVREMPNIDSLAILYKDKIDFIFLTNESDEKINRFLKEKKIKLDNCIFMNDEENTISYLYKKIEKEKKSYPTHIIVNNEFIVFHHHTGAISGYVFDPILTKALIELK